MRRLALRLEVWEVFVYAFVLLLCAPNTVASRPIERSFKYLCYLLELDCSSPIREPSAALAYWIGTPLLFGLLVMALRQNGSKSRVRSLVHAVAMFALLYIADWFLSTDPTFRYSNKVWAPYTFAAVFLVVLLADARQAQRLVVWMVIVASVESMYAIVAHLTGQPEFVTPGFGRRAGGSFQTTQPNTLYPLSMLAASIATAYALRQTSTSAKLFYVICACINVAALLFTFSRSGWLGLAFAGILLGWGERSWYRRSRIGWTLVSLSVILLSATFFVRTQGKLMGNREDRPAWGRIAIWKVAVRAATAHPVLGSGVGTYPLQQSTYMTDELRRFGPGNKEAKNLLLNILVETGIVGLFLWLNLWLRYLALYQQSFLHENFSPHPMVIGSGASFVALHVAGLFDTPVLHVMRVPSTLFALLLLGSLIPIFRQQLRVEQAPAPQQSGQRYRWTKLVLYLVLLMGLAATLLLILPAIHKASRGLNMLRSGHPVLEGHSEKETAFTEIPAHFIHLLVASEDGNFYQHRGVDWQALHRALRVNIRALRFKQGGSTITMQTARYLFVGREKTLSRKLAEILLAMEMEKRLSKERILELYLNSARFGLGAEDIGTASRVYFGKTPKELALAEAAFLAGVLPEPPKTRGELTPEKVERCKRRALMRLGHFFAWRYSPQQIERAMRERVVFVWER